ncbi:MAG: anthranilate phosphoribosyltransferase [Candidatus Dadabacteria bacterium]|nr:anthranilate phosphoribosyltransferase [Candidatus Dadabacteria bacterium]NIS09577.1 anthranilate phosphoribosyltransferase [Candidatus Dadabacteria bacterium]NIV43103.1 anthranilate phosphoribosyltransferase [Candidatus Dadabacteria bacterium]NIX16059.1 anthranilate phosphoribosyltransferase [Candidatus Dadabacteria bacterium]NIY22754.1 anthranilate phosphoribosyltransferase [Candidatus Dadabacteria bacterium]
MTITEGIAKVVERVDLSEQEMISIMEKIMEGSVSESQIGAFLVGLRMKGESISEITGAARVMRAKSRKIHSDHPVVVDLCGTGGDMQGTFNISTVASFITVGAGVAVAKHGNRSVSSKVGSADVLEELGVNISINTLGAEKCLNETGFTFLFAPNYHPAMKNVGKPRKEVGIRTIFNILGPLTNPVSLKHQIMGVYSQSLIEPLAKVFRNLDYERAMVVHGSDSLDEFSVTGKTDVAELNGGIVKTLQVDPLELGLNKWSLEELKGDDLKQNAGIALSILKGQEQGAKRDISVLNSAASILVANKAADFKEAIEKAQNSIDSGSAIKVLEKVIKFTTTWN